MALQFVLKENVLTDDLLHIPENDKIFKGNYIAIIEKHEFINSWNDKKFIKKFRDEKILNKYLEKNYPDFDLNNYL